MRKVYFLYGSLGLMLLSELLLIGKGWQLVHLILFFGLPLLFVVTLIVTLVKKGPWDWKLKVTGPALILLILLFYFSGAIEMMAFDFAFAVKKSKYEDFATTVLKRSDELFKEKKKAVGSEYVFETYLFDSLFADAEISQKKQAAGIWSFVIHEIREGVYVVDFTVVNGRQTIGLVYNPTGGIVDPNTYLAGRVFWGKDGYWSMWKEAAGSFAAPG